MKLLRPLPLTLRCLTDLELNLVRILGGEGVGMLKSQKLS